MYSEWLKADPKRGQGYVGWARNYERRWHGGENLEKAAGIYEMVLGIADVRGRYVVVDQALQFYEEIGDNDKADELREELSHLKSKASDGYPGHSQISVSSKKVGRNEPCPCGSGKKYKRCCGA